VGGDRLANIVVLHDSCHKDAHSHPESARARGIIVSSYGDPLATPIEVKGKGWFHLDDEGGKQPV